ncbi:hypothetical protein [Mycobacterium canetti]|uniref:hypothetical protein n=1 Tax=Mycobacterium canetti TaxID=78331 RepID=UPI001CD6086A|nr:hypothetical protein [Mycobacterium canetti]
MIGAQLVKLAHIKLAWRTGNFVIYAITIVCVVFLNLLEGVPSACHSDRIPAGAVVRAPVESSRRRRAVQAVRVDIDGTLSFLLLPRLTTVLSKLPEGSEVTLNLNADYIDDSVSEAISDWRRAHETRASGSDRGNVAGQTAPRTRPDHRSATSRLIRLDWFRGDQRAAKTAATAALRFSTASTSTTAMARPCCTRISPG